MTKRTPSPSTLHPSFPNSYKSRLYLETENWDAHLKVDHDGPNPFSLARLLRVLPAIERVRPVCDVVVYRTAKGHHVRVWLFGTKPLAARTVLRLQALLGDDPQRQRFNMRRVRRREMGWSVLWNVKYHHGRLTMIEVLDKKLTAKARKVLVRS